MFFCSNIEIDSRMEMFPKNNLYELYKKHFYDVEYSEHVPDITKKRTLDVMNIAINACDAWGNALDIGGGGGHYSIPLLHKFKKVVLVDMFPFEGHAYLKRNYPNFEYHHSLVEDVMFHEKFDYILLSDIYEHINDIDTFVRKIASLQEKNGVVYILTPNQLFCGPAEKSGIHQSLHKGGHFRHYLPHEIINLMKSSGYELVYQSYEEGKSRQIIKRIIKGVSRRDKKMSIFSVYNYIVGPCVHILFKPALFIVEYIIDTIEKNNKNNKENTMAMVCIFKKL